MRRRLRFAALPVAIFGLLLSQAGPASAATKVQPFNVNGYSSATPDPTGGGTATATKTHSSSGALSATTSVSSDKPAGVYYGLPYAGYAQAGSSVAHAYAYAQENMSVTLGSTTSTTVDLTGVTGTSTRSCPACVGISYQGQEASTYAAVAATVYYYSGPLVGGHPTGTLLSYPTASRYLGLNGTNYTGPSALTLGNQCGVNPYNCLQAPAPAQSARVAVTFASYSLSAGPGSASSSASGTVATITTP